MKASRWASFMAGMRERLARSRRVFLLSLLVACGIEVVVDWNSTLFEINVLRGRVRERGMSYVHILAGASDDAMVRGDAKMLSQLSEGLFSDEDVVFVRYVDPKEALLYEQIEPTYAKGFQDKRQAAFTDYFAKQITRDLHGVMFDFEGQKDRMAKSRYRDVPQRWNDMVDGVLAHFITPAPPRVQSGLVLYQEALRTAEHEREGAVTYAFGTVPRPDGLAGAVLVAFSMDRTNASIFKKYLKGLGMVLFFVALILVQNVSSRHDKLRLLDLERRYAAAKKALRDVVPEAVVAGNLSGSGVLDQAGGTVDGQLFVLHGTSAGLDALVIDPDGEGIEAAAVALQVRQCFLQRRTVGPVVDLLSEAAALGQVDAQIPLSRPLGLLLVHVDPSGALSGLVGPVGGVRVLRGSEAVEAGTLQEVVSPEGVVGPLRRFTGTLGEGETLLLACAGLGDEKKQRLDLDALAAFVARSAGDSPLRPEAMADAASWVRGRSSGLAGHDLVVVGISRSA
jgi:hypothetical protein